MRRYRRPAPKPYEIAIDEFYTDNDECLWNGYLEEQVDEVTEFIPDMGEVRNQNLPALEEFRKLQNLYYDVYNNGGCNAISMNDDDADAREHWGMSKSTMSNLRRHPDRLEARLQTALGKARSELIEAGLIAAE